MTKEELYKNFNTNNNEMSICDIDLLDKFFETHVCITKDNIEHLEWIYNRMVNVYDCNINLDYMLKFASIIGIKPKELVYEWQWLVREFDDTPFYVAGHGTYYTENEIGNWNSVSRIEETKRVRQ